jgi:hypothetical protein
MAEGLVKFRYTRPGSVSGTICGFPLGGGAFLLPFHLFLHEGVISETMIV